MYALSLGASSGAIASAARSPESSTIWFTNRVAAVATINDDLTTIVDHCREMLDGDKDLDNAWGNWWLANLEMEAALKFKHYDYKFVGGTGGHNGKHGGAILPDSLRWLWRTETAKETAK